MAVVPVEQKAGGGRAGGHASRGPRAIGALMGPITRVALRSRSSAGATVLTDWADIVGPALAEATRPRRLAAGVLTIGCAGPVAVELSHGERPLVERINRHLGSAAVTRLRLVHEVVAPRGLARRAIAAQAAPVAVPGVGEALAEALGRLGGAIAARAARGGRDA